jgi:IS30 family transposase
MERYTNYIMLAKIKNKDTESVVSMLIKQSKKLLYELYKSLTWYRGTELAYHERFTLETDAKIYSCVSRSPWQRG